jgi:DNA-directed RNA polymerase subunit M/transcription elongation factor TFIIS
MDFCDLCDNMLYLKMKIDENKLFNHCKNCNFEKELPNNKSFKVLEKNYEKEEINYDLFINPYIKYDPTLPRINNIHCLNKNCTKDKEKQHEIIYIKYNNIDMKYLYYCVHCDYYWNTES